MQPGHLRRVLLTGTLWTTVATYGSGGINFVTTAVLTRLLMPAAFGVGAIVGATAAFFDLLAEMAVGTSVVQRRDLTQRELSSIWWLAIAAGIGIAIAFAAGGRAAGRLLASADVGTALPAVGITAIVYAVASVPQAMLRRELRFRTVAATQATGSIAGAIAAIAFALFGFGYWGFVAQAIVNGTGRAGFAIAARRWRAGGGGGGGAGGRVRGGDGGECDDQSLVAQSRHRHHRPLPRHRAARAVQPRAAPRRRAGAIRLRRHAAAAPSRLRAHLQRPAAHAPRLSRARAHHGAAHLLALGRARDGGGAARPPPRPPPRARLPADREGTRPHSR